MTGVSFLLTVYNKASYLPAVLTAVRGQTGDFSREIVIVDDGSTDESLAVARCVTEGWPDVRIVAQANAGASAAMNRAAEEARLAHLKLVDSDDLLAPSATNLLLRALAETTAVLAVGQAQPYDYRAIPETATDDAEWRGSRVIADALAATLHTSRYNPSVMLLRRADYFAAGGCDPDVTCQEYSLSLPLALRGGFVEIPNIVAHVARGDSNRLSASAKRELANITRATLNFVRRHPDLPMRYRRMALKKAAGRARLWAQRHGAPGGPWPYVWRHVLAQMPLPVDHARGIEECLRAFGEK
ncbi:MAG: glycosyltransferase [Alphaproteobacteria bacterium]|nr:glycosyltransferase [Alphaproteobacteria bacterium]